jgi:hypothetical protein
MQCRVDLAGFSNIKKKKTMARMTEEEAHYWDKYYTENPPKPGPNGTGFFSRRRAALSITVDSATADYLTAKAVADHKTPAEIIGEMVRERLADAI